MSKRTVALQQVTSDFSRKNAKRTLEKSVSLDHIEKYLELDVLDSLRSSCPNGAVFIWGVKLERTHQFRKMNSRRCLVLFRRGTSIYKTGVIIESIESLPLAEKLWGVDRDGQTWGLIYFLKDIRDVSVPAVEINRLLGWEDKNHWQGLVVVSLPLADLVIEYVKDKIHGRLTRGKNEKEAEEK
jgi:hypothetical protein